MKKIFLLASIILVALASCGKDSPDNGLAGGTGEEDKFADKLSVYPATAMFSAAGGSVSVKVSSPGVWFISPKSYDWVSVDEPFGTNNAEITFTAEPNTGADSRGPVEFTFTSNMETFSFFVTQTSF